MNSDALLHKRCAFVSKHLDGNIDLMVLRGSTNNSIIQKVIEDFFDMIFHLETLVLDGPKHREQKNFTVVGWAGGSSLLRIAVNAAGSISLLSILEEEWSKLAFRLARKLDLSLPFNPDRPLRFLY